MEAKQEKEKVWAKINNLTLKAISSYIFINSLLSLLILDDIYLLNLTTDFCSDDENSFSYELSQAMLKIGENGEAKAETLAIENRMIHIKLALLDNLIYIHLCQILRFVYDIEFSNNFAF